MSGAREEVLGRIRAALNRGGPIDDEVASQLDARIADPPRHLQPAVASDAVTLFIQKLTRVKGTVDRVDNLDAISEAVGRHLSHHELGDDLVIAPDPDLEQVRWSNRYRIERRAADGTDRVSVTSAFAGIAETASCMLLSGAASPTTLNFLPDDHIVVLHKERIVMYMEDAWARLRKVRRDSSLAIGFSLPRTVNLISGPSKTGDVELTIQEGAHGPRRLHVILVG